LIECKTYRFVGHHEGDPGTAYRTKDEVEKWKQSCPLKRAKKMLLESGVSDAELKEVEAAVTAMIDDAVEFAENSPEPLASSVTDHVF
jgi:pyruvate dehydrogenase E1 component alpha subunit